MLLDRLLNLNPEWRSCVVPGDPDSGRPDRLEIPSEHPTITTPLTIELAKTMQLFWYGGYFYDFLGSGRAQVDEAFSFILDFFAERQCRVILGPVGAVSSGGPIVAGETPRFDGDFDRIEVRSWRGTLDAIYENDNLPQ